MSVLLTHGVGPACCICKMGSEPVTYMGVINKQTEARVPGTWHLCPSEALPRCSQAGKLSSLTCHSHHASSRLPEQVTSQETWSRLTKTPEMKSCVGSLSGSGAESTRVQFPW